MLTKDFIEIFINRESQLIEGSNKQNLFIVALLFFVTFFAIAYSLKGLDELKERLDNPFTNWVDLPVMTDAKEDTYTMLKSFLDSDNLKDSFGLSAVTNYNRFYLSFSTIDIDKEKEALGRTVSFDDNLLKSIISVENNSKLIVPQNNWNNCGIIITYRLLESLGLDINEKNLKLLIVQPIGSSFNLSDTSININNNDKARFYIPVYAIVNELPNYSDFVLSPTMDNCLSMNYNTTGFIDLRSNNINLIIKNNFSENDIKGIIGDTLFGGLQKLDNYNTGKNDHIKIFFNKPLDLIHKYLIFKKLNIYDSTIKLFYETECVTNFDVLENPHYISFNFNDLKKVKNLKNYIKEKYKLELNMSLVEDKENFSKMSILTNVTTSILFLIGLSCITLFTWFFLKNHLNLSRKNLGTLSAFGLDTKIIIKIYTEIMYRFYIKSSLIGLISICCIICIYFILNKEVIANIIDYRFLLAFLFTIFLNIIISKSSINKILNNTPGNLIYGRIK